MRKKLLLADDSITIQKVIGITFAGGDYELTVVGDGEAALERARTLRPDLILADVFMPGKNGYEVCAAVKQDPDLQGVPVLLLTGTFEPFDEEKAAASGADSWISKPFESQALIDRVGGLLDRAAASSPESIPVPAEAAASFEPEEVAGTAVEEEDIWADLAEIDPLLEQSESEPEGLEEAFATPVETGLPGEEGWGTLDEQPVASGEMDDPFALAETEDEGEDEWTIPSEETEEIGGGTPESVWSTFEDEEILDLEESDILEDDLEGETVALLVEPEVTDSSTRGTAEAPSFFEALESETDWSLEPGSRPSAATEDFLSAEEDPFGLQSEGIEDEDAAFPPDSEPEIPGSSSESFLTEADYAFSLEEEEAAAFSEESIFPPGRGGAGFPLLVDEPVEGSAERPLKDTSVTAVEAKIAALSEEELARIVEKVAGSVIERLAQTMLERIAWEVVPDLAESMIKDEIRKIREEVR